ncbi:hypothetical protein Tco_0189630 [Tanacetum coccineum]
MLVDVINQRKRFFAQQRAEAKRNKPMTQAQQRTYMSNYIKHMGTYTIQQLRRYTFDELRELFETTMKHVSTFVPMETKDKERASELTAKSSKRPTETELDHESSKKQKNDEASGSGQAQPDQEEKDWEVYFEDTRKYWKIIRVELKRLFEPDNDDTLWKLQRYIHDPLVWKLYDTCGVHHVSTERGQDIFMLIEKEYPLTIALMTLMLTNKLQVEEHSEMANELLMKIFILENRPRQ